MSGNLLQFKGLTVEMKSGRQWLKVVEDINLNLNVGEILCLVGESGSGKSVTALSVGRLHDPSRTRYFGEIILDQTRVFDLSESSMTSIRGRKVAYVFQDPAASLNPTWKVGAQVMEMLRLHQPEKATNGEVVELFKRVGISAPETRIRQYPFELSGGMQQRVMIAMALAARPKVLIADEPTTALDVTIQDQILNLLMDIRDQSGMGILLITHNLAVVRQVADQVAVMYGGQLQEIGSADQVLEHPQHPYTRYLMQAVPCLETYQRPLHQIPGSPPSALRFPAGCRFHPRCPKAVQVCTTNLPALSMDAMGHGCRCHFPYGTE